MYSLESSLPNLWTTKQNTVEKAMMHVFTYVWYQDNYKNVKYKKVEIFNIIALCVKYITNLIKVQ